jgi:trk system potassium uptake protein TrkA
VTHAVVGDAQDKEVLRALGVRDFDCAIVAIGSNLAASVLTVMNLQELEVPCIICKAHDETHRRVLEKLGVDRVVIPECEFGGKLARSLSSHNVLDYIELSEEYGILEVPAPKLWVGKTILELNVRAKLGVNIIAVKNEQTTNVSPSANYQITAGDVMVVLGDNKALEAVQKL